jgi:predicted DNA-binding transcriptional regulator YafY
MPRSDRMFNMIQILRDGQLHRARDLAETLDVTVRTIWRDMATLMASGLPVDGERGVGYMLTAPITLPPIALTREEFEALRLGMTLVASAADPALARASASLRAKIAAVTPGGADETGSETFVFSSAEAARAAPHLGALRRAIREHLKLRLVYRDITGAQTTRGFRPLQLEFWGRAWTLTGWCELRNDFRVLRVDLIESLATGGEGFLPEPGKTVEDYLARFSTP